jgi:hypothetical protein
MYQALKVDTTQLPNAEHSVHAVAACAALLEHSWSAVKNHSLPDQIRNELEELAHKFPDAGREAIERFDGLIARAAELAANPPPLWLETILKDSVTDPPLVQILPTAIVFLIPDEEYRVFRPGSDGVTFYTKSLPPDLVGRVIVMPHPPRDDHENTLCHEIIHTFDNRTRTDIFVASREEREISKATQREAIIEHLRRMTINPRQVARGEVLAYDGSGHPSATLDSYGVSDAREELDAIFRGLAMNPHLPRDTKRELYAQAADTFRQFVVDTMALRVAFNERIREVGPAAAIAEAIIRDQLALNYEALNAEAREVTSKLTGMLDRVEKDSSWQEWSTKE